MDHVEKPLIDRNSAFRSVVCCAIHLEVEDFIDIPTQEYTKHVCLDNVWTLERAPHRNTLEINGDLRQRIASAFLVFENCKKNTGSSLEKLHVTRVSYSPSYRTKYLFGSKKRKVKAATQQEIYLLLVFFFMIQLFVWIPTWRIH